MEESLYIVMPAYNEEANIVSVVEEWYPILDFGNEQSRLVIADGGSKDNTLGILRELQEKYPKLVVFSKPGTDHGTKVIFLYKYAIEQGVDWIFQTDSDGQTLPSEFEGFWQKRHQYDTILGNRTKRGDGNDRKFVEWVLRMYLFTFFGTMVPDANAPFRLMKAAVVNKYISLMPDDFNLPNAILAMSFKKYGEKLAFDEITFRPRQGGKNYMNKKRIIQIGKKALSDFRQLKKNFAHLDTAK